MSLYTRPRKLIYLLLFSLSITACHIHKDMVAVSGEKTLIAEQSADWLRYKVYLHPVDTGRNTAHKRKGSLMLSIMIINMKDNTSPLRKLCTNLDDYNRFYAYLLNNCKDDIAIRAGNKELYPVYYAFENNYDAFPFETINIGFEYDLNKKSPGSLKNLQLIYNDKVFSNTTINCKLNYPNK